jgi:4-aminobutyrate aminotransferase-like enzyme
MPTNREIHQLTDDYVLKCMGDEEFVIYEAEGVWVKDAEGRETLDAISGEWVVNLGYRHPRIMEAVRQQLSRTEYATPVADYESRAVLAQKLSQISPGGKFTKVLFALAGGDAVEGAMHLAMRATGGTEFVTFYKAFHGRTFATIAMSYSDRQMIEESKVGLERYLTKQNRVPNFYCYRCPFKLTYPSCDLFCADFVETAIQNQADGKVAGVVAEPWQANGAMVPAPEGWMQRVREITNKYGALLIVDEVQSGLCRCGPMFAVERTGVEPDLIVLGKALGGGFPLSAVLAKEQYADLLKWEFGFTQMGHPVSCAAGAAMIDVMVEDRLWENAEAMGARLMDGLREMQERYPLIGDLRGWGLMVGVELVTDRRTREEAWEAATYAMHRAYENGLMIGKTGPVYGDNGNVLKLKPAVNVRAAEIDEILRRFDKTMAEVSQRYPGAM